ncbi:MAG: IS5 family transposase [Xenococcus sp. (in: cyanobacteria)]
MYRTTNKFHLGAEKFELPFGGKLSPENRWVKLAQLIPWSEFESEYASQFSSSMGAPAKSFRMALWALIIKERLGTSDIETVEQIKENPYLQYFLGLTEYTNVAPFEASMLVHFRQRLNRELVGRINERIILNKKQTDRETNQAKQKEKTDGISTEEGEPSGLKNRGKLILDATCTPADISYPTDLKLLNQAREYTEKIVDKLYQQVKEEFERKPRTYRIQARKNYLEVAKQRRPRKKKRRKAIRKQLAYLKRNLSHIDVLLIKGASLSQLSRHDYRMLLVISELLRQQQLMYESRSSRIDDRIVSLTQPHVRPLVRGKAGKNVEFGAKLSVSYSDGYCFLDHLSWDNFNESLDLQFQIEQYQQRFGYYPESVHVDRIYPTRANRAFCKERGIRISAPPLGRPPAEPQPDVIKQRREDEKFRNAIEGKFGQAKRRFSLNLIMAKLSDTAETTIAITFLVMNLELLLKQFCALFFFFCPQSSSIKMVISAPLRQANNFLTSCCQLTFLSSQLQTLI